MKNFYLSIATIFLATACSTKLPSLPAPDAQSRVPSQTGEIGQVADTYLGDYRVDKNAGEITVKKVLKKPADLFNAAVYDYALSVDYRSPKGPTFFLENAPLSYNEKSKTLSLSRELECDDPGCWYSSVDITLKPNKKNELIIELDYRSSVPDPDDGTQSTKAQGRTIFYKIKN